MALGDFVSEVKVHYPGGGEERLKELHSGGKVRIESAREVFQMAFDDRRAIVSDGVKVLAAGKGMCIKYQGGPHQPEELETVGQTKVKIVVDESVTQEHECLIVKGGHPFFRIDYYLPKSTDIVT